MDTQKDIPMRRILLSVLIIPIYYIVQMSSIIAEIASAQLQSNRRAMWWDREQGEKLTLELRTAHPERMRSITRLTQDQFEELLEILIQPQYGLQHLPSASAAQQLAIYLLIVGQNASYRLVREMFGHSTSSISRYFHRVSHALCRYYRDIVSLPPNETPRAILEDSKLYPYFKDALGAVDGSYVPVGVKNLKCQDNYAPWRCRKGFIAQNIMAAVDFDMNFLYVLAGWEGSAHDGRVLRSALDKGFRVPPGKYYLADAGYSSTSDLLLTPYHKTRYHLKEWEKAAKRPKTKEELFNLRHAQARNVVERTFGVFKSRFKILKEGRDGFSLYTQMKFIYALAALHNFLNSHGSDPVQEANQLEEDGEDLTDSAPPQLAHDIDDREMLTRRDEAAEEMWRDYKGVLLSRRRCIGSSLDEVE
jgi:DDE superfamily endonuclease